MTKGVLLLGPLSPSKAGQHFIPVKHEFTPPRQVTNATTREPLDLSHEWRGAAQRPGSNDHRQYVSLTAAREEGNGQ